MPNSSFPMQTACSPAQKSPKPTRNSHKCDASPAQVSNARANTSASDQLNARACKLAVIKFYFMQIATKKTTTTLPLQPAKRAASLPAIANVLPRL